VHEFSLLAYVFMPEHVHLIIRPRQVDHSVSALLKSAKQSVSRRVIAYLRTNNPDGLRLMATGHAGKPCRFWQAGGVYDRNIIEMATLGKAVDYTHANPVRRGLVESATGWYWSSARDWSGQGHGPLKVDLDVSGW